MNYEAKFNKNGNIKVGDMWTFNKLAGSGVIAGCNGTCGEHCKGCYNADNPKKSPCYVFGSYVRFGLEKSTVVRSHIKNTNIIRNNIEEAFNELDLQIKRSRKKPDTIRIHSSGELETLEEIKHWYALADKYPKINFYIYTKATSLISKSLTERQIPQNFTVLISIWHESGLQAYERLKNNPRVKAFVYDDGYDYKGQLTYTCHCPAYTKTGKLIHDKTCEECRLCIDNPKAKVIACYDH